VCTGSERACAKLLQAPNPSRKPESSPAKVLMHSSTYVSTSVITISNIGGPHSSLQAGPSIEQCAHLSPGTALPPQASSSHPLHSVPAIGVVHMLGPAQFAALYRSRVVCGLYRSDDQPAPGNPAPVCILTMGQRGEVHRKCRRLLVGRFPWETSTGKSQRSHLPINERRGSGLSGRDSPHGMTTLGPNTPAHGHRKSSAVMAARCEVASHLTASIAPGSILMINSQKDLLQTVYSQWFAL
jgi:hypothetical protein